MSELVGVGSKIIDQVSNESVRFENLALSLESQKTIVDFTDRLRSEVGDQESWNTMCKKADEELEKDPITEEKLMALFEHFGRFHKRTSPGHDKGHEYRDALAAIYNYSNIKDKVAYQSDAMAGLIGGIFHDIGVVIVPRGSDKNYGGGHAEAGAYFFNKQSQKFLGENLRKLVSYTIAAHTAYQSSIEVEVPPNYIKRPYWDEIYEKDNKLCGVAIAFARMGDRTDIHSIAQPVRNIISQTYSYFCGNEGSYMTSEKVWAKMGLENAINICLPLTNSGDKTKPTTLQQSLGFLKSIDDPFYSKNDKYFPGFSEMLRQRSEQVLRLDRVMNEDDVEIGNEEFNLAFNEAERIFFNISKSDPKKFEIAWNGFKQIWDDEDLMPENYKRRWVRGFSYIKKAYTEMIDDYQEKLLSSDFPRLTDQIIRELKHED